MSNFYTPPPTTPAPRTSTMAIISLIAGILGLVQILPGIGPIAAIITGHMAQSEIKKSGGMVGGKGLATTGLVLGYGTLVVVLCGACLALALAVAGVITIPFLTIPFIGNTH